MLRNSNRTRASNNKNAPRNSNKTRPDSSNRSTSLHSRGNAWSQRNGQKCGNSIGQPIGSPSTATGGNAVAITATAFPMTAIVAILGRIIGSASTPIRWSCTPGYPRFHMVAVLVLGFMDPWPEYWSDDWYDNDDVYVAYSDDGYYLYNRRYPQDRIAITVYVN